MIAPPQPNIRPDLDWLGVFLLRRSSASRRVAVTGHRAEQGEISDLDLGHSAPRSEVEETVSKRMLSVVKKNGGASRTESLHCREFRQERRRASWSFHGSHSIWHKSLDDPLPGEFLRQRVYSSPPASSLFSSHNPSAIWASDTKP